MFDTTKDIFWFVAALSLGMFTLFVCWMMYYFIMTVRNVNFMVTSMKEKIELLDKILKLVKEKLEKTSGHLSLIADTVIKLAGYFMDRQAEVKKSKKKQ